MIDYLIHLLRNYDIWVKDNRKEQGFKVNSWWVVLWSLKMGFKSACGQHLYLLLSHSNAGNTVEMSWLLILLFALNLFPMFNRTTTARQMFPTMVPISYGFSTLSHSWFSLLDMKFMHEADRTVLHDSMSLTRVKVKLGFFLFSFSKLTELFWF